MVYKLYANKAAVKKKNSRKNRIPHEDVMGHMGSN